MFIFSADLRRILVLAAIALLGIFVATMLALALPLQLLQPSWISRLCGAVLGGVSFPLLAMVLLVLAEQAQPMDQEPPVSVQEQPLVTVCRRLSLFVALGFVLMIPLQSWAGVQALQQVIRNDQQQLVPYRRALELIRIAETPDAMAFAISTLPGAPGNLGGQFRDPLPRVRQQLFAEIEPQIKATQTRLEALNGQRWQELILRLVKDGIVAGFSALAFAAVGRNGPEAPTLLSSLWALIDRQPPRRMAMVKRRREARKRLWP